MFKVDSGDTLKKAVISFWYRRCCRMDGALRLLFTASPIHAYLGFSFH